jgi:GAF domain-containing protein
MAGSAQPRRIHEVGDQQRRFEQNLAQALRVLDDAVEIRSTTCRLLRVHLGADRVIFICVVRDNDGEHLSVVVDEAAPTAPPVTVLPVSAFSASRLQEFRAGRPVVVPDVSSLDDEEAEEHHRAMGVGAYVAVPVIRDGAWVATLGVHQHSARGWTEQDVVLIEEVAHQTWAAL